MTKKKIQQRKLEAVVISDVHLGIYACKAKELLTYLKSIKPDTLILNGDIIDGWQFSKNYFPDSHLKVVRYLLKMLDNGTTIYYVTGNHDESFRRFADTNLGNLHIVNKMVYKADGKETWIFHGDVFDLIMHHSKWLAKLGAHGYGLLTLINKAANFVATLFGKKKLSLARNIKNKVKGQQKKDIITNFEKTVADIAINKDYDFVICGHTHHPCRKKIQTPLGVTTYLNSGDWVDNMTALEYFNGEWNLAHYQPMEENQLYAEEILPPTSKMMLKAMLNEFTTN